jgi:acetate kinase
MQGAVLALNAGSSTLKFALYERAEDGELHPRLRGAIDWQLEAPRLRVSDASGGVLTDEACGSADHDAATSELVAWITRRLGHPPSAAGHRIVHGGDRFVSPVVIDPAVMAALEGLGTWAPLHQPQSLAAVRAIGAAYPGLPQVACFDTAFHATQPAVATRFALPQYFADAGVRRYGFHGLSYAHLAARLRKLDPRAAAGRVIAAHLGSGASLGALRAGHSIDTTMGFSPLDGLVMSTRCGALDPGVVLHLQSRFGLTTAEVEDLLYRRSGLLGVSGISGDMRVLLDSGDAAARAAVELFVYRIAREAGALASSLGGLDGLVFTGGVGENAATIRAQVCARLAWLGLRLDPASNAAGRAERPVHAPASRIPIWIIPADEEGVIAQETAATADLGAPIRRRAGA